MTLDADRNTYLSTAVSNKLIDKTFYDKLTAKNILQAIAETQRNAIVFVDKDQHDMRRLIHYCGVAAEEEPLEEKEISTEDWYRMRALLGDFDLEEDQEKLQAGLKELR